MEIPEAGPAPEASVEAEARSALPAVTAEPSWGRVWACALACALAAGLAAWGSWEPVADRFEPEKREVVGPMGAPLIQATPETIHRAERNAGILAAGLLGGALGLGLGVAGGLARGSALRAAVAGMLGLGLGVAAGEGTTLGVLRSYHAMRDESQEDIMASLLVHGAIWSSIGAAAGLAFGIGLGGGRKAARALVGGAVGAAIGAVLFELIGGTLFPMSGTTQLVSITWGSRLTARLLVCMATVVGVALAVEPARGRARRAEPAAT
jgi:hypothetical protein